MKRIKQGFFLVGLGFLAYAIHAAGGIAPMVSALIGIGWWYPLAFGATIAAHGLRTAGWGMIVATHTARPSLIVVEAVNKGLNALFFFLPMQIGVAEGGNAALLHSLKMGAATGLTLGLGLRVRALIWSSLGLAMLLVRPTRANTDEAGYDADSHAGRKEPVIEVARCDHASPGLERRRPVRLGQTDPVNL